MQWSSKNFGRELMYNDQLTASKWALNSAVECHLHTVEVIGSNPIAPTIPNCKCGNHPAAHVAYNDAHACR